MIFLIFLEATVFYGDDLFKMSAKMPRHFCTHF